MWQILQAINWEHVLYAIFTVLTACGVSLSWLKKMCSKIEATNTDVEAHKEEIRAIVAEMRELVRKD